MHQRSILLHQAVYNYACIFTYNGGTTDEERNKLHTFTVRKGKPYILIFLVTGSACFVPGASAASIMPSAGYNYKAFRRYTTTGIYSSMCEYRNIVVRCLYNE